MLLEYLKQNLSLKKLSLVNYRQQDANQSLIFMQKEQYFFLSPGEGQNLIDFFESCPASLTEFTMEVCVPLFFLLNFWLTWTGGRRLPCNVSWRRGQNVQRSWQPSFFVFHKFLCFHFFIEIVRCCGDHLFVYNTGGRRRSFAGTAYQFSKQFDNCATQGTIEMFDVSWENVMLTLSTSKGSTSNQRSNFGTCSVCESQWKSCFWHFVDRES